MAQEQHGIARNAGAPQVAYDADVVVGAGPGGFAAALQAARMGVRVLVVEKLDMSGGVHTSGLQGSAGAGVGGIHTTPIPVRRDRQTAEPACRLGTALACARLSGAADRREGGVARCRPV